MRELTDEEYLAAVRRTLVLAAYTIKKPIAEVLKLSDRELLIEIVFPGQSSEDPSQPHLPLL